MGHDWVRRTVFYQIFPDRFRRSGRVRSGGVFEEWDAPETPCGFKGGDLPGVEDRLDHLADLGVNAIYFTPVFKSTANHRYHTFDYLEVDPILGGDAALKSLLHAAHARGLRVVLDGVFNHCSRGFFQFNHLLENGAASPYRDWFHAGSFPLKAYNLAPGEEPNYGCWWGLPALPKFNTAHPEVRRFIFDVARRWLEFGIDGWRLDVPTEIDDDAFWREFRRICKGVNPDCYLVGEIWTDARRWLRGDMFDGVMNYLLPAAVMGYFAGEKMRVSISYGGRALAPLGEAAFRGEIRRILDLYPLSVALSQMNIMTSHDTDRMRDAYGGDERLLRLGLVFTMAFPGAPNVYYGEEVGLEGLFNHGARQGMPWDEGRWDRGLLDLYRKLIRLRRTRPALADGEFELLDIPGTKDLIACRRWDGSGELLFLLNRAAGTQCVQLDRVAGSFRELIASNEHPLSPEGGLSLELEPFGYAVLEAPV